MFMNSTAIPTRPRPPASALPAYARFLQPDPIGYDDGMNMYGYVGADPVNNVDPTGTECTKVTGSHICKENMPDGSNGSFNISTVMWGGKDRGHDGGLVKISTPVYVTKDGTIVVTAARYEWVSSGQGFYFNGRRYVSNPYYQRPWYADYVDYGFVVGPPLVAAAAAAATPAVYGLTRADVIRYGGTPVSNQLIRGPGAKGATWVDRAIKGGGKEMSFHYHIHRYNWYKPWKWFEHTPIIKGK